LPEPDVVSSTSADRLAEVKEILNGIIDPCSAGSAVPIGLVDMGIVDTIEVEDSAVRIALLPTFAGCLFVGIFETEIERRTLGLAWCTSLSVEVIHAPTYWDESRMSDTARSRLRERRDRMRRELEVLHQ
jgi:metal-sulfur cluster biosynthetic enzyme